MLQNTKMITAVKYFGIFMHLRLYKTFCHHSRWFFHDELCCLCI